MTLRPVQKLALEKQGLLALAGTVRGLIAIHRSDCIKRIWKSAFGGNHPKLSEGSTMMMRKEFELIAIHLNAMYPRWDGEENTDRRIDYRDGYNAAINQIAGACYSSNSQFDLDRFKKACGVE